MWSGTPSLPASSQTATTVLEVPKSIPNLPGIAHSPLPSRSPKGGRRVPIDIQVPVPVPLLQHELEEVQLNQPPSVGQQSVTVLADRFPGVEEPHQPARSGKQFSEPPPNGSGVAEQVAHGARRSGVRKKSIFHS